jgi:iron complex outermembrane recepter protein
MTRMLTSFPRVTALLAGLALYSPAIAEPLDTIAVTATRIPEPADQIPADLSIVSGKELLTRGASDMASALRLVPGVEAPAGGDAGPSSAVPSFWGLHEFDAFLLVVDGVPWGGAFNPAITTLDFTDVERVEVLKGAAPVLYGATSFVGVVQALHYPAGDAAEQADIAYGAYGSLRGSASLALPPADHFRQSLALEGERVGFADAREVIENEHLLYRGEWALTTGTLRLDADLSLVRDVPPSPVIRQADALTSLTPLNANFNPADAKIDEDKYHLVLGYTRPSAVGVWDSLVSFAYSEVTDIRAFLHPDLTGSADTQNQRRNIDDGYFDTHLTHRMGTDTTLIIGDDLLYGFGHQITLNGNGAYTVPLTGSALPPPTSALIVNEIGTLADKRLFVGQYAQVDFKPTIRWDVLAGIRLNEAYERKVSSDLALPPPQLDAERVAKTMIRPSETLGVSYRLFFSAQGEAVIYADFRNAFKPSALDFGPDYTPTLLSPETAQSVEAGLKGSMHGGRVTYQAEWFLMHFNNLVVATASGALANAAGEKLKGAEIETQYQLTTELALIGTASYHDAQFTHYLFFDGVSSVEVAGRQLPLSPHVLASAGLSYMCEAGVGMTVTANYSGRRYLDEENSAPVGGYTSLAATINYTSGRYRLTLEGNNLSNRRPPVSASEFGSQSFYLLPARMLWLRAAYRWR